MIPITDLSIVGYENKILLGNSYLQNVCSGTVSKFLINFLRVWGNLFVPIPLSINHKIFGMGDRSKFILLNLFEFQAIWTIY